MIRSKFNYIVAAGLFFSLIAPACWAGNLVAQTTAARYGMKRAWFAQVGAGQATGPITYIDLESGMLLVQTRRNLASALDPETGRVMWSTQVGPPQRVSTEPAANEEYVVIVNGSELYVLSRVTGAILWQRRLGGGPGAGPALTPTHAFVPMLNGHIEGYELEKGPKQTPWVYSSAGRVQSPPMVTPQTVSWTTQRGYFYVADPVALAIRFRLETRAAIQSRPAYWTPELFACSTDGNIYAVNEASGKMDWKFTVGDAIYAPPVAIENKVYVISELAGMYCLDGRQGTQLWFARGIKQFLSASPTRVYACDRIGGMAVLDAKTGTRLATMPLDPGGLRLINSQSDRIYLANDSGVVQCLHEAALTAPVIYTPPPAELPEDKAKEKSGIEKSDKPSQEPDEAMPDEPSVDDQALAMEDKPEAPAAADEEDPFK